MKRRVYLETTIPSMLTARPSRDLVVEARRQLTREWWELRSSKFDLVVSRAVVNEARAGDRDASQKRLDILKRIPILATTDEIEALAELLIDEGVVPAKVAADAFHIACATVCAYMELYSYRQRTYPARDSKGACGS